MHPLLVHILHVLALLAFVGIAVGLSFCGLAIYDFLRTRSEVADFAFRLRRATSIGELNLLRGDVIAFHQRHLWVRQFGQRSWEILTGVDMRLRGL